jgi:DNA-binding MarR family transcriptional regulator
MKKEENTERPIYTIPPLQIHRLVQLMPAYYKIFRSEANINTYQASVLLTIYNIDTHNAGIFARMVGLHNPMSAPMILNNLKNLVEMGYVTVDKRRYSLTVAGLSAIDRITNRLNSYKGETIHAVELEGSYFDRIRERKQKAINKLANNPHMIKAALQVIEDNKLKGIDSNDK